MRKLLVYGVGVVLSIMALTACKGAPNKGASRMTITAPAFVLDKVTDLQKVAQLTGEKSPNQTNRFAVYGTDLGSMFNAGDRTYFVFGDTFGERPTSMTGGGGSFWRSNTMAYSTDKDPSDGIKLDGMITDELNLAKELLPSKKRDFDEMTKIPTHGLYANDTMYLYYMSVNHWGLPGEWDTNFSSAAKSTDQGKTWTFLDNLKWPGDSRKTDLERRFE